MINPGSQLLLKLGIDPKEARAFLVLDIPNSTGTIWVFLSPSVWFHQLSIPDTFDGFDVKVKRIGKAPPLPFPPSSGDVA